LNAAKCNQIIIAVKGDEERCCFADDCSELVPLERISRIEAVFSISKGEHKGDSIPEISKTNK
jgi:hypothetical protein